ncbi:Gag-pol Polyprotein [Phytophthora megakarya]|uniref:Gag-pol Polyprotein n=1 Tax=Phytophthora megakarya TaxID=4795 RepID=A0A225VNC5_9STRA|nr:Gag-pol Polyprotein [Phytophthora megakarya]
MGQTSVMIKVDSTRSNVRFRDYVVNNVVAELLNIEDPSTYKQAYVSPLWPKWRSAVKEKLESLRRQKTWRLTQAAKGIICRWVYALKRDQHGRIKRYKARLVIHGFKQEVGFNFHETYAPVVRFESICTAVFYAMKHDWDILPYDVKTGFWYGDLEEVIYMGQPAGIDGASSEMVGRLLKSLHRLRQAPRIWNDTLKSLLRIGFAHLDSEYAPLQELFKLTELGQVRHLLGVEILVDRPHMCVIFASKARFKMENAVDSPTPQATAPPTSEPPQRG